MNRTFIKNFNFASIFFSALFSFILMNNAAYSAKSTFDEDGFEIITRKKEDTRAPQELKTGEVFFNNNLDLKGAVALGFSTILGKIDSISKQIQKLELRGKNELAKQLEKQRQALIKGLTENFERELIRQKEELTQQLNQQHQEQLKQHQKSQEELKESFEKQQTQANEQLRKLQETLKKMQSYTYALPFKLVAPLFPLVLDSFLPIPTTFSLMAVAGLYYLAHKKKTHKIISFAGRVVRKLWWNKA